MHIIPNVLHAERCGAPNRGSTQVYWLRPASLSVLRLGPLGARSSTDTDHHLARLCSLASDLSRVCFASSRSVPSRFILSRLRSSSFLSFHLVAARFTAPRLASPRQPLTLLRFASHPLAYLRCVTVLHVHPLFSPTCRFSCPPQEFLSPVIAHVRASRAYSLLPERKIFSGGSLNISIRGGDTTKPFGGLSRSGPSTRSTFPSLVPSPGQNYNLT